MKYKDYEAIIKYSDDDETFVGEVINTQDILIFDGSNIEEVTNSFHAVVDDYLNDCAVQKKEPNKPFSGQFLVRGNPELHRALAVKAKKSGKSLNSFVTEKLASVLS